MLRSRFADGVQRWSPLSTRTIVGDAKVPLNLVCRLAHALDVRAATKQPTTAKTNPQPRLSHRGGHVAVAGVAGYQGSRGRVSEGDA